VPPRPVTVIALLFYTLKMFVPHGNTHRSSRPVTEITSLFCVDDIRTSQVYRCGPPWPVTEMPLFLPALSTEVSHGLRQQSRQTHSGIVSRSDHESFDLSHLQFASRRQFYHSTINFGDPDVDGRMPAEGIEMACGTAIGIQSRLSPM
jgi:hypothetical protein